MSTITEDDRIRKLFYDIQWNHVQLSDMKVGDKSHFLGIEKESNIISINKRNEYKEVMEKAEVELYSLLDRVNRIEIRESFEGIEYAEELRNIMEFYSDPHDMENDLKKEILEYLSDEEIIDQDAFFYNYYRLSPPYVKIGTEIPEGIKIICNESRLCYVFCQYNATIVLSRSVIETVLNNKMETNLEAYDAIKNAKQNNIISEKLGSKAHKIRILANEILHDGYAADEEDAKFALDFILTLFEEIYF